MRHILLLCTLLPGVVTSQPLLSYQLIKEYKKSQIDSILSANGIPLLLLPTKKDIAIYKVLYATLDADSLPTVASGAVFVPKNPDCLPPLFSYQHGTITEKHMVPSTLHAREVLIGESLASDGAVVAMPDYIGLGDSPGFHPYVHAATEAWAVADLILATHMLCDTLGIVLNGQHFLLGYSQGGHATMAAHQWIQEHLNDQIPITASTPMAGPYDMGGVQAQIFAMGYPVPNPAYLPYFLLAYNDVYNLFAQYSDFLVPPYDSLLPVLFNGTYPIDSINAVMPAVANQILQPAVLDSFNTDSTYRLHAYLKLNDTYRWKPESLLRMYYCEGDLDVPYQNALVAQEAFVAAGSTLTSHVSAGANLNHAGCFFPTLLQAKFFFDSLRRDKIKVQFDIQFASSATASDGKIVAHAFGGFPPYTFSWSHGDTDSIASDLSVGLYTLTVTDATGCPVTFSIFIGIQTGTAAPDMAQLKWIPNPATSATELHVPQGIDHLCVYDVTGRCVMKTAVQPGPYRLERGPLPSGSYLVKLLSGTSIMSVQNVVFY